MEALLDLIYTIIKVYLVSFVYVKVYSIISQKLSKTKFCNILPEIKNKRDRKYIRITITIILILFSFTYWGNKGYGDEALIPLGFKKHVEQINSNQAYINPEKYKYRTLNIEKFDIQNKYVFGESINSPVDSPPPYFVWNFETEEFLFFDKIESLKKYLATKNINQIKLKTFNSNYLTYWNVRILLMA